VKHPVLDLQEKEREQGLLLGSVCNMHNQASSYKRMNELRWIPLIRSVDTRWRRLLNHFLFSSKHNATTASGINGAKKEDKRNEVNVAAYEARATRPKRNHQQTQEEGYEEEEGHLASYLSK
jgi:hypothetical protein